MKKISAILSVILCASVVFCSCAKKEEKIEPTRITTDAMQAELEAVFEDAVRATTSISDYEEHSESARKRTVSSYRAYGSFSEGMAFVEYTDPDSREKKYAYIDKNGNVLFELPEGYVYGYEFHDGLAVVAKEHRNNYGRWETKGYAVIDNKGKLVFDASEYNNVSRASEGVICAIKTIESYNGTINNFYILDYNGNVITTIERSKSSVSGYNGNPHYTGMSYMQYGSVCVDGCFYDKNGNIIKDFRGSNQSFATQSIDGNELCYFGSYPYEVNVSGGGTLFNRRTLEVISEDHIFPSHDCGPNLNGYSALHRYNRETETYFVRIRDINGNTTDYYVDGLREIEPQDLRESDNRWIVELQNNYYSIINEKGEFIIEPVEDSIYYMGESKYYISGTGKVVDVNGKHLFTIKSNVYSNHELYSNNRYFNEGMIYMEHNDKFMSDKGEYINKLTIN